MARVMAPPSRRGHHARGCCAGAELVLNVGAGAGLTLVTAILGVVTLGAAAVVARDRGHWRYPSSP